jgi:hypothetical protein
MNKSQAFVIPDLPDDLPPTYHSQWHFACMSLERVNARISESEDAIRQAGPRMKNRSGGYSASPESRALAKAIREGDRLTAVLLRLLGHIREPEPVMKTIEDMRAELIANLDADDCGGEEGGCPGCDDCMIEVPDRYAAMVQRIMGK